MFIFKQVECKTSLFSVILTRDKKNGIIVTDNKELAEKFCKEYDMKLADRSLYVVANADNVPMLDILKYSLLRRLTVMSELNYVSYHKSDVDKVKNQLYTNPALEVVVDGYRFYTDNEKSPFKAPRKLPMYRNNGLVRL